MKPRIGPAPASGKPMNTIRPIITRKPCYRKDDRAMRPLAYMGVLKSFGSPCPQLIFPTFLMDFCSDQYRDCAYKIWSSYLYPLQSWGRPNSDWLEFWVGVAKHNLQEEKVVRGRGWNRSKNQGLSKIFMVSIYTEWSKKAVPLV